MKPFNRFIGSFFKLGIYAQLIVCFGAYGSLAMQHPGDGAVGNSDLLNLPPPPPLSVSRQPRGHNYFIPNPDGSVMQGVVVRGTLTGPSDGVSPGTVLVRDPSQQHPDHARETRIYPDYRPATPQEERQILEAHHNPALAQQYHEQALAQAVQRQGQASRHPGQVTTTTRRVNRQP